MQTETEDLRSRIEILEKWIKEHSGPERGKTSLNFPHTGIVYLDESGLIPEALLPASVSTALYYL